MKHLLIALSLMLSTCIAYSQSLKKYEIGNSGCRAYFFCDPGTFKMDNSPDSSKVYTGECNNGDVSYGIICVSMKDKITDLGSSEEVMISYLDYLKTTLKIKSATGYGKGHRLKEKETTRGVIDYWKDEDGTNWKIKGWTDGKIIAVMFAYANGDLPETKVNVFLDGLLLPGM